jgi:hypothetical protein
MSVDRSSCVLKYETVAGDTLSCAVCKSEYDPNQPMVLTFTAFQSGKTAMRAVHVDTCIDAEKKEKEAFENSRITLPFPELMPSISQTERRDILETNHPTALSIGERFGSIDPSFHILLKWTVNRGHLPSYVMLMKGSAKMRIDHTCMSLQEFAGNYTQYSQHHVEIKATGMANFSIDNVVQNLSQKLKSIKRTEIAGNARVFVSFTARPLRRSCECDIVVKVGAPTALICEQYALLEEADQFVSYESLAAGKHRVASRTPFEASLDAEHTKLHVYDSMIRSKLQSFDPEMSCAVSIGPPMRQTQMKQDRDKFIYSCNVQPAARSQLCYVWNSFGKFDVNAYEVSDASVSSLPFIFDEVSFDAMRGFRGFAQRSAQEDIHVLWSNV